MRTPSATYRIQFGPHMDLRAAARLLDYLHGLGISDLYASPVLRSRPRSSHGYDVVDPTAVDPELGGEAAFDELCEALAARQMGLLMDVVPNHMAASTDNPWWRDVLEHGPASAHGDFFDIDWQPPGIPLRNRVLLPILGRRYGRALERGELRVALDGHGLGVRYFDHRIPLEPGSYPTALGFESADPALGFELAGATGAAGSDLDGARNDPIRMQSPDAGHRAVPAALGELVDRFRALPDYRDPDPASRDLRHAATGLRRELVRLHHEDEPVRAWIDTALERLNGRRGDPPSFDALDALLTRQPYQLAFWKAATEEINYRRFFNIGDLVSLRMERPEVFHSTHELVLRWVRERKVTGLRIDHVDGLYDPREYLDRLLAATGATAVAGTMASAEGSATDRGGERGPVEAGVAGDASVTDADRLYVIVEKILSTTETLPDDWPVAGTTGYDFLNTLNGIFVDPAGLARIVDGYRAFTGEGVSFDELVYLKKRQVLDQHFAGEVGVLARSLRRLANADRHGRDLSTRQLARAVAEVTANLGVYRSYARDLSGHGADGRRHVERALAEARRRRPGLGSGVFDFLERVLLVRLPSGVPREIRDAWLSAALRWQQLTGPVMAKGLEDAALYIYNPLVSLNDVGSHPGDGAVTLAEFHRRNALRQAGWPGTMNATSTHDTKRGEDVRARINALSDMPLAWNRLLNRWARWNRTLKEEVRGRAVPTRNQEVLLYQTLLGAWPLHDADVPEFRERLDGYLVKAAREAKEYTSWLRPDTAHEEALVRFARRILEPRTSNRFLEDFRRFQPRIAFFGALNSLSQLVLKLAAPGMPDFYQGAELWEFTLVDPDNRRPVDFERRKALLRGLRAASDRGDGRTELARELVRSWPDGRIKLYVTCRGLELRRERPVLFRNGAYVPLAAGGRAAGHLCAFGRRIGDDWVVAAAPLAAARLTRPHRPPLGSPVWADSALSLPAGAPQRWRNIFTDEELTAAPADAGPRLPLSGVFASFPVALLVQV